MQVLNYLTRAVDAFKSNASLRRKCYAILVLDAFVLLGVLWFFFISAPFSFPTDSLITVRKDVPVSIIAEDLERDRVIRSSVAFRIWMRLTGSDTSVTAGRYYFKTPHPMFSVASRIGTGNTGIESIRVTLTEGMTVREMAEALETALPDFDRKQFIAEATQYEGYLFPDTYFIEPGTPVLDIIERMRETFATRTKELQASASEEGKSFADAVILASLIEKEADTAEDRRTVSGILHNRIEDDMPLQIDAVFGYILNRSGYAPTGEDLSIDSPYNTYTNRGLPPGPIANPGLDAITAALYPSTVPYFYYLTGRDGKMYVARTFDEHRENRRLYLD